MPTTAGSGRLSESQTESRLYSRSLALLLFVSERRSHSVTPCPQTHHTDPPASGPRVLGVNARSACVRPCLKDTKQKQSLLLLGSEASSLLCESSPECESKGPLISLEPTGL